MFIECLLHASAVMVTGGKNGEQKGYGPYSWSAAEYRDITPIINGKQLI